MKVFMTGLNFRQDADCELSIAHHCGHTWLHIFDRPSLEQLIMALEELKTLHDAQMRVDAAMRGDRNA
jgi:hypothetical protein